MVSNQRLLSLLQPIPPGHKELAPVFYEEAKNSVRQMTLIWGGLVCISVIVPAIAEGFVDSGNLPAYFIFELLDVLIAIAVMITGYRTTNRSVLYALFFGGQAAVFTLSCVELALLDEFTTAFILSFIYILLISITPMPTVWPVSMQIVINVAFFTTYFIELQQGDLEPFDIFTMSILPLASIGSIGAHIFLTHQRWQSFFNHRQLQAAHGHLKLLNAHLQDELILAHKVQKSLLPPPRLVRPQVEIACCSEPVRGIGGDFYTYRLFGDGRVGLAVGDVSGKGTGAALLMAASLSLLGSAMEQHLPPEELAAQLDHALAPYMKPRRLNCALCYVEVQNHSLCMVNAGCIPPFIRRADGRVEWPELGGFALGQELGAQQGYEVRRLSLAPGDLVVLTSDGVAEVQNREGEIFGFERLGEIICTAPATSAQAMLDYLLRKVTAFTAETELRDDITIVVLRIGA